MSNNFLTPSIIAREALMILQANMVMAGLVYRAYEKEFGPAKVGNEITIPSPATFEAKEFSTTIEIQNANELGVSLTLEKHFDISLAVTSADWTLKLDDFSQRIVSPAMAAIAQGIDAYMLSKYKGVYNFVGTAGDPPDSLADLAQVDQVLNDLKVPFGNRISVVNPKTKADMMSIDAVTHAEKRGDDGTTLREASIGRVMGIDWYMGQNVYQHTAGTFSGGTPAVNSVVAAGEAIMDIDGGAAAETIKAGDVFTVAGHDGWYGVFTADKTASTGAISGATFTPGAPTGGFADGDVITIVASHSANLAFHPNAFALAVVPLELPRGTDKASYINYQGMGIRVVFGYDNNSKKDTISFDVLCGAKCIDPRLAVRVLG